MTTISVEVVDFEHLIAYLDDVVDACEPAGDPHDWKDWYRNLLLRDDAAIDQIWRKLRALAKTLSGRGTAARNALADALSYIGHCKPKMRYAARIAIETRRSASKKTIEELCIGVIVAMQRIGGREQSYRTPHGRDPCVSMSTVTMVRAVRGGRRRAAATDTGGAR